MYCVFSVVRNENNIIEDPGYYYYYYLKDLKRIQYFS